MRKINNTTSENNSKNIIAEFVCAITKFSTIDVNNSKTHREKNLILNLGMQFFSFCTL